MTTKELTNSTLDVSIIYTTCDKAQVFTKFNINKNIQLQRRLKYIIINYKFREFLKVFHI